MTTEIFWIRFFPGDWLSGTSGLTAAERGVYITILALIYDTGGAIIRDDARLARKCGVAVPAFRRILDDLIADGKIEAIDGRLSNRRASREIDRAQKISGTRAKTAAARWDKTKENQSPKNANAMQMERESESESDIDTFEDKSSNVTRAKASVPTTKKSNEAGAIREAFKIFWDRWPNKVGKPAAEKAFVKVWRELPAILAGIDRYIATMPAGRQWLNPATFLNQRRWEDAPAPVAEPATRAVAPRRNADGLDSYRRAGLDLSTFDLESQ